MPGASTSYRYAVPLIIDAHLAYASDAEAAVDRNISFDETQLLFIVAPPSSTIPFSSSASFPIVTTNGHTIPRFVAFGVDASTSLLSSTTLLVGYRFGLRAMCPPAIGQSAGDPHLGEFSPFYVASPLASDLLGRQKWSLGWLEGKSQITCVDKNGNSSDTAVNRTVTLGAVELVEEASRTQTKLAIMALPGGLNLYAEARTQN